MSDMNYSDRTIEEYVADLQAFRSWAENEGLDVSTWRDLELAAAQYLRSREDEWSPSSIRRRMAAMRAWAKHEGRDKFLRDYRPPTAASPEPHPMPGGQADVVAMCVASKSPKQAALVALCGLMGLRVSEAIDVRLDDINWNDRTVLVRGKGNKRRRVPIPSTAMQYLRNARQSSEKLGNDLLCPFSQSGARQSVTIQANRANLPYHVSSHDLRATFATAAYNRCNDILVVSRLLGHSNVTTTQQYIGSKADDMRKAAGG
jgi:site-specific recombinase XerD